MGAQGTGAGTGGISIEQRVFRYISRTLQLLLNRLMCCPTSKIKFVLSAIIFKLSSPKSH